MPDSMEQTSESLAANARHGVVAKEFGAPRLDPRLPAPNFFIVGAAKAGTTSLYAYLTEHPEVFMSPRKEPHFFSLFEMRPEFDNFDPPVRDPRAYQELFLGSEGRKAVGEASPSYLCDPDAAIRIKSAVQDAKIVISLRNPVQRAYSAYLMEYSAGRETLPFRQALEADERRTEKGWGVSFGYVELGLYAEQVEHYLEVFGRGQVLVILFEDLIRETATVMQQVARFLDVDPARFPESTFEQVHNRFEASRGPFARALLRSRPIRALSKRFAPQKLRDAVNRVLFTTAKKPKMDDEARRALAERFAPNLQRLERLLERDLGALR
jgi:hypothetical protein